MMAFVMTAEGYIAHHPGQGLVAAFDGGSTRISGQGDTAALEFRLRSFGFAGRMTRLVSPEFGMCADGLELSYGWTETLEEWWVQHPLGLEHGMTLARRPDGARDASTPLTFELDLRGPLEPVVDAAGTGVDFLDQQEHVSLRYAGLFAVDAAGTPLQAWLEVADGALLIRVMESEARYPITIDPIVQQAYLKASNTDSEDFFGQSVAISGDTVIVGALGEDSGAAGINGDQSDNSVASAGAAYVFVRAGQSWVQEAYLKASNPGGGDTFGFSVAIDGDLAVVGAPNESSGATGVDGDTGDDSAPGAGAAYVFRRSGGTWSQEAYIKASNTDAGDGFASAVDVSEGRILVGARQERSSATGIDGDQTDNSAPQCGAAYVFAHSNGAWAQEAYLKASNAQASDAFGYAVAISGDTAVVTAFLERSSATGVNGDQADNSSPDTGAAYVFRFAGGTWGQEAYLKASNTDSSDRFGSAVAISGNRIVVGAPREDSAAVGINGVQSDNSAQDSGAAYVFSRDGVTWSQDAYLKASNAEDRDMFGWSVAVSEKTVLVAAFSEGSSSGGVNGDELDNSALRSGAVYAFVLSASGWSQQAYLKAARPDQNDLFGHVVGVSGDTVVVGANLEGSSATGVNGNDADNSAFRAGAAYVFDGIGFPGIGKSICVGEPNSTGACASLAIEGSQVAADNNLTLLVEELPILSMGYFLTSADDLVIVNPGGSEGTLCIASLEIGRYANQVLDSGQSGSVSLAIDLLAIPNGSGVIQAMAGDTRNFQYWYRDTSSSGVPTSNFSGAQAITFE